MLLAHEEGPRLKIAVVGCGNHAYRSIFPCFDYLAVDLVAAVDQDLTRAEKYAAHFGARAAYQSLREVIARGEVEAVILVVGPRQHPELACEALAAGLHVWMEKPPATDVAGVERMIAARNASDKNVVVGFKKAFMPAMKRMKAFLDRGTFGRLRTIQARFPTDVPFDGPAVLAENRFTDWLGNGVHPLSLLVHLGGRPDSLVVHRSAHGGGFVVLHYPSGAVGNLHLALGQAASGPRERYECVCENGHMVLDNNVRLTVYRPGYPFDYRRGHDFTAGDEDVAALIYEPQYTLSTLENKAIFIQGFFQELDHFVTACLEGTQPENGTLEMARAVMECYEAALLSQGAVVSLGDLPAIRP
ncbi:MAG: Gfo/Idh/MocA family oxidoreductase [Armatimonadota bacterium]|nr:Gfo/Idh/MocA family oxidoreductase [Armatimonadota bacterium]